MKRFFIFVAVFALSFVLVSCAQLLGPAPSGPGTVQQAITDINARFADAYKRGDAASVAAFYTQDAKLLPPNNPMISGGNAIQAFWQAGIDMSTAREVTLTTLDLGYNGDLAYEVGTYMEKSQLKNGQALTDLGKYLVIWKRQSDGSWKLAVDTWNSNASLPAQ